jgi:hypothetical protein
MSDERDDESADDRRAANFVKDTHALRSCLRAA